KIPSLVTDAPLFDVVVFVLVTEEIDSLVEHLRRMFRMNERNATLSDAKDVAVGVLGDFADRFRIGNQLMMMAREFACGHDEPVFERLETEAEINLIELEDAHVALVLLDAHSVGPPRLATF